MNILGRAWVNTWRLIFGAWSNELPQYLCLFFDDSGKEWRGAMTKAGTSRSLALSSFLSMRCMNAVVAQCSTFLFFSFFFFSPFVLVGGSTISVDSSREN